MRTSLMLAAAASSMLFVGAMLAQPAGARLMVDKDSSTVTYHLRHKLHKVDATCHLVEGRSRSSPQGQTQVSMRVKVESCDSGNANRDAHMKEIVEATRFPYVELKAAAEAPMPALYPAVVDQTFHGELNFHGMKKALDLPIQLTYESADRVHAVGHFVVSLEEFKIERPSLMFVKVDDTLQIDVDLVFKS